MEKLLFGLETHLVSSPLESISQSMSCVPKGLACIINLYLLINEGSAKKQNKVKNENDNGKEDGTQWMNEWMNDKKQRRN